MQEGPTLALVQEAADRARAAGAALVVEEGGAAGGGWWLTVAAGDAGVWVDHDHEGGFVVDVVLVERAVFSVGGFGSLGSPEDVLRVAREVAPWATAALAEALGRRFAVSGR